MKIKPLPYEPDYAVKPSATILELAHEKGLSNDDLKTLLDWPTMDEVITAQEQIGEELAERMEKRLGGTKSFWLNHERNYRATLKRLGLKE